MSRAWFVASVIFAAATLFATLGLREHYLIDLMVAVPLAVGAIVPSVGLHAASETARSRR